MTEPSSPAPARRKRRKRKLPPWTHPTVYAAVRLAAAGVQLAGSRSAVGSMHALGGAYAGLPANRKRLDRARANIARALPDLTPDRARELALDAYRHLFVLAAEVAVTPRLITPDGYAAHVELGELAPALRILQSGEPCLLITGHCGNWELLGYTLALLGFPVHALYRPLDMKPLDRWVQETRSRRGLELVDKFGAAQKLPPIVERGDPVAFIADQNAGDRGLFVPFFGRLASAYKTPGVLAMRYRAPILCGCATRLPPESPGDDPFRYRIDVVDVVRPADWDDQPDPLFYITARYRRAIETMVRRAPEQYLWMHRYWKSRPRHERQGKPFPDRLRAKLEALPWTTADEVEALVEQSVRETAARAG